MKNLEIHFRNTNGKLNSLNDLSSVKNYKYDVFLIFLVLKMELIITNVEYSFDPTPKLKSSPIPIEFISFNVNNYNCIHCGEEYTRTLLNKNQKYCKKCLSHYISNINDNNVYLDVHYTMNLECVQHEINKTKEPQNIQECCRNCFEILCFKQIPINYYTPLYFTDPYYYDLYKNVLESEEHCKLCGKSLYQGVNNDIDNLCSDCYLISSGRIKSTLTEQSNPIIYLPWWHDIAKCIGCGIPLIFTSDCQKYCRNCLIFYTCCRYCLTTNAIFGPTNQSQCKWESDHISIPDLKMQVTSIILISSGNHYINVFFSNLRLNIHKNLKITEFADKVKNID
jgi:hypothetical protein